MGRAIALEILVLESKQETVQKLSRHYGRVASRRTSMNDNGRTLVPREYCLPPLASRRRFFRTSVTRRLVTYLSRTLARTRLCAGGGVPSVCVEAQCVNIITVIRPFDRASAAKRLRFAHEHLRGTT